MKFPASIKAKLIALVESTLEITETSRQVISDFEDSRSGHKGPQSSQIIERLIHDHSRLDLHANRLTKAIRSRLFQVNLKLEPADLLLLMQIVDQVSELADSSQMIGARLQVLMCNS